MSETNDFISEFKANVRHFIADNPPPVLSAAPVDVLPLLAYIDQLDRDGGITSAVSDKLRALVGGIDNA